MLNENIRAAENTQAYPGDIFLPMDLFELCEEDEPDGGVSTEIAMEQAVSRIAEGKKRKLLEKPSSPVKKRAQVTKKVVKSYVKTDPDELSVDNEKGDDDLFNEMSLSRDKNTSEPAVVRPLRSGRLAKVVRYKEVEESERETEKWDIIAGKSPKKAVSKPDHVQKNENRSLQKVLSESSPVKRVTYLNSN